MFPARSLLVAFLGAAVSTLAFAKQNQNVTVTNTADNPVVVSPVGPARGHLNVPAADHVVLVWVAVGLSTACGSSSKEFRRLRADGSFDSDAFVVPAGRTLIVTDANAVVVAGAGNFFPQGRAVHAAVMHAEHYGSSLYPYATPGVTITDATTGAVAVGSSLGAGFAVAAGKQICIRGDIRSAAAGFVDANVTTASVRAYLL